MTLPVTFSWCVKGEPMRVPYEAPQGRRVNAVGAVFTHGPNAGDFVHQTFVSLPKSQSKTREGRKKGIEVMARNHGLSPDVVGPIDANRLATFIWEVAGRPNDACANWRRERPLMIVLDNYSVHKSQTVKETQPLWEAADVFLVPLPSYCPEMSRIETVWNDVKHHHLPTRSCKHVADQKHNVDTALQRKARQLKQAYCQSDRLLRGTT
jgi:hypothetical protein